jgi:hypothetical protein
MTTSSILRSLLVRVRSDHAIERTSKIISDIHTKFFQAVRALYLNFWYYCKLCFLLHNCGGKEGEFWPYRLVNQGVNF